MSKDLIKYVSDALSKEEKLLTNTYSISKKLERKLNVNTAKEILFMAEEFCEYVCSYQKNNPNVTCLNNCHIWKIKNKALGFVKNK